MAPNLDSDTPTVIQETWGFKHNGFSQTTQQTADRIALNTPVEYRFTTYKHSLS